MVVAADDPSTADFAQRHRDWRLLADQVDLHELADGGHYFLRTRPAEAAQAVLHAADCCFASRCITEPIDRKDIAMSSSFSASPLDGAPATRQAPDAAGRRPAVTRPAGPPSTGTRCAPWSLEHGCVLVRGLGLRDAAEVGAVFQRLAGPV